jgi:broad specificity phosphatase PhoE
MPGELWLIRHGETEWSRSGAHTGRTDLPLTEAGREEAAAIARRLGGKRFALVLTSPLQRALETCRLAGYGDVAQIEPNLLEWDYGDYEGLSTADIRKKVPGWNLWIEGFPRGETIEQVAARARAAIDRATLADSDVALFAHGHILRILTACWLALPPACARLFALSTASLSTLGYERETRVITRWNQTCAPER